MARKYHEKKTDSANRQPLNFWGLLYVIGRMKFKLFGVIFSHASFTLMPKPGQLFSSFGTALNVTAGVGNPQCLHLISLGGGA